MVPDGTRVRNESQSLPIVTACADTLASSSAEAVSARLNLELAHPTFWIVAASSEQTSNDKADRGAVRLVR
jgi:hypothetical protein